MKGLINLKNKDHKRFMQCHVRLINPENRNVERINKQGKKIGASLNYPDIAFLLDINDYEKIESGITTFTNYNKQITILFKIYADTECFLKRTQKRRRCTYNKISRTLS